MYETNTSKQTYIVLEDANLMFYTVAAFYQFVKLDRLVEWQDALRAVCLKEDILGTVLLAEEGINATISGIPESIERVIDFLCAHSVFSNLEIKYSGSDFKPFDKMKVLIKKEIVTFGVPGVLPTQKTGVYVTPQEWNALVLDPAVLLVDTRNDYEVEKGTFFGATNPDTKKFSDFVAYVKNRLDPRKHKKVAMFCTGGIRCEKASAYLLDRGFEQVYQLQGGILKYLETVEPENSLWQGKCFIFDQREVLERASIQKEHSTNTPCVP